MKFHFVKSSMIVAIAVITVGFNVFNPDYGARSKRERHRP